MPSSRPTTPATPASPKTFKIKDPQPGVPLFGCEHTQLLLSAGGAERMNKSIHNYKTCLRVIFENTPIVPQTSKTTKGFPFTTLTPNYLCLQCSATTTEGGRIEHGRETSHRFYVESRNGCLYCQMCDDFVFDPTLEDLRLRKSGKGLTRKRKLDDLFTDPIKEDPRFISTNTVEAPCRASGIRGIYNMGATCYMNVILQSFVHNPLLRNFYLSDGHQRTECSYENCMSCAMEDMFQDFYAQETTTGYSASNILASFWLSKRKAYEELASNKEQDAHEFFQFLTEELHEINGGGRPSDSEDSPVKKSKSDSDPDCKCIVHQTFYGKLQSTITCQSCGDINTSIESFLDLSLGLDVLSKKKSLKATALSLQKCLDEEYSRPERCEYSCRKCNTQEAKKQLSIKSLPNVLCIQLKRFKQNNGIASKIDTKVSFPLKLEMFPYTNRAKNQETKQSYELARSCTYDLQSVVVHVGNLETGHYVSYSRVGNQWFKFNDHNVTLATKSQVLNEQAFLLFYVVRSLA
ncbi:Cysteine proteinase [Glarea lozoyensis ATCC 20868]|uniref:Ubiquitin carboxyl-terminal hydrolase n=1 Tax=Glarea lozoyensis (strain ATCC 20868 / MF5171) TaxID=1116229 RepID=S3D4E0_GLAL2|nr:Cysteine proteinase [Glarea lozoyensis ATCC 20868]EPE26946.1 Cysteine proteinase [Glarea lozoyensis ATCC 20868]